MSAEKTTRKEEMKNLRFQENWTLEMIAEKYGVSRERVRQIVGNSRHGYVEKLHKSQVSEYSKQTNEEVCQKTGLSVWTVIKYRFGSRHAIKGGYTKIGAAMEDFVSEKLCALGIKNKLMSHSHPFDILLDNGKRVDVKSCSSNKPASFQLRVKERGFYADYFVLILRDTKDMFIVPFGKAPYNAPVRFNWPASKKKSKWQEFYNRFDLLTSI